MRNRYGLFGLALLAVVSLDVAQAQTAPNPAFADGILLPAKPTSADNIILSIGGRTCSRGYAENRYSVSMAQNNITVKLGEQGPPILIGVCPSQPRDEIDLGKLPAGSYTVTVIESVNGPFKINPIQNAPFTVTDARVIKQKPWVSLNYLGMWWDPADSGSGLFIWQDAIDNTFAAWFTYSADGKPSWYVFQPVFGDASATRPADLLQTDRKPGTTIPPPNPTSNIVVGTASLDFSTYTGVAQDGTSFITGARSGATGTAKFEVTFKGQATRVITIQRFKP